MCGSQREQSHGGLMYISVKGTFTLIPPKQMYSKDKADMKTKKRKLKSKEYYFCAQEFLTETSMCLKRFKLTNRFLTALYVRMVSENYSHLK